MDSTPTKPRRYLAALAALIVTPLWAHAAIVSFTRPNTNAVVGPVSVTLNGTTFVNLGLQGVGRIPASQTDAFGLIPKV
jgi:hypothetical protein